MSSYLETLLAWPGYLRDCLEEQNLRVFSEDFRDIAICAQWIWRNIKNIVRYIVDGFESVPCRSGSSYPSSRNDDKTTLMHKWLWFNVWFDVLED